MFNNLNNQIDENKLAEKAYNNGLSRGIKNKPITSDYELILNYIKRNENNPLPINLIGIYIKKYKEGWEQGNKNRISYSNTSVEVEDVNQIWLKRKAYKAGYNQGAQNGILHDDDKLLGAVYNSL
jgi:hypothetical protein